MFAASHAIYDRLLIDFAMRRLAWVAGFCIGPFGGNERPWKPFNPILGETFELDLPENGVRFLAEQVQTLCSPCVCEFFWRA